MRSPRLGDAVDGVIVGARTTLDSCAASCWDSSSPPPSRVRVGRRHAGGWAHRRAREPRRDRRRRRREGRRPAARAQARLREADRQPGLRRRRGRVGRGPAEDRRRRRLHADLRRAGGGHDQGRRSAARPSTRRSRAPTAARSRAGTSVKALLAEVQLSYQLTVRARAEGRAGQARLARRGDRRARAPTRAPRTRREAVDFVSRRYEPGDLVALRIELKGARRTRRAGRARRRLRGRLDGPDPPHAHRAGERREPARRAAPHAHRSARASVPVALQPGGVLAPAR